jgi:hypothetical protein
LLVVFEDNYAAHKLSRQCLKAPAHLFFAPVCSKAYTFYFSGPGAEARPQNGIKNDVIWRERLVIASAWLPLRLHQRRRLSTHLLLLSLTLSFPAFPLSRMKYFAPYR